MVKEQEMKKLVAFYSRADENYFGGQYRYIEVGNTEKVANMIIEITGGDRFKIEEKTPYSKNYQECVKEVMQDLQNQARPALINDIDISGYDAIYLGYPNYCGKMPMAVYTFLESHDFGGKVIHPFCTHEGSGIAGTIKDISKVAKGVSVDEGLAINGSRVDSARSNIEKWVK